MSRPQQPMNWNRRELLRIGGLSLLVPGTLAHACQPASARLPLRKQVLFIMLQGGPSHLDLWDPKPRASQDVRGPFDSRSTAVPGTAFGSLLPGMARIADRLMVIRSMTHEFTNHIAGTYITLTGSHNQPDRDREAHADDFPGPGAVLNHLVPNLGAIPNSISLPNWLSIPGPSNRMPGQYGGFLGNATNPFLVEGDPNAADYNPLSLRRSESLSLERLEDRRSLLQHLDHSTRWLEREQEQTASRLAAGAYELLTDGRVRNALQLDLEASDVRDRYGRHKFGQSLLLAKRLLAAGVPWISLNEFNQKWDTHGDLERRYQQIVPPVDQAFTALIEDLDREGRLDDTLVVLGGEFGRTPRVNAGAGRDHWPNAYSVVVAGGGFRRGGLWGETDHLGGEVLTDAVEPADLLATIWHQLGIPPRTTIYDRLERPHPVSEGRVLRDLLG